MTDIVKELAERAKELPPDDRSRLVDLILQSLEEPPTGDIAAAWDREVQRRLDQIDRGEVTLIPADEVFAEARRLLR